MVDFDPNIQEVIMTPDLAMRFLVWTSYYHNLEPKCGKSFARFVKADGSAMFAAHDVARLDRLQEALFKCFDPPSVKKSVANIRLAKEKGEPCPFSEQELDILFGKTL
ncbi:MAG: hypothetical protein K6F33_14300 [Bacteroidales bacterium]|nr:hypothetical protein [Bacteroidales bacterium]